jgi:putative ABC transport system permease protein
METLIQDLRYGFRTLLKSRGFTLIAVISLALGIGANTTIFTLVNAVFLQAIPVRDPARVMSIYTTDEKNKGGFNDFMPTSYPNFEDYRDQNTTFEGMSAFTGVPLSLSGSGEPEQLFGLIVSGNYFDMLGAAPALGRAFLQEEDRTPGTHPVVVLSHGLWARRFGSDPGIIGRTLTLNGQAFTVIGVARQGFKGTNTLGGPALWVPMMMHPQLLTGFFAENFNDRRALMFNMQGRLKPGVSREQALAELQTIGRRLEQEYPTPNKGRNITLLPVTQTTIHPAQRRAFVLAGGLLMTVVGLVLLIACANVANLLLARATARRKEIAIRLSLGAGRARLVRQLLTESLLLSLLGGGAGLLIAAWGRDLLLFFRPPQFQPENLDLSLDGAVLGFTLAVSLLTGLMFGLAPALQASRQDLAVELKDRTSQPGRRGGRVNLRGLLVVGQVALSLISLIGAGLFLRSLRNTQGIDPGFETKNLLSLNFDLGAQGYDVARGRDYHRRVLDEVGSLPGVRAAALSTMPLLGGGGFMRTVFPEGQEPSTGAVGQFVFTDAVSVSSLETQGVALLRGRGLTEMDREGAPRVVVVNEAMAERFWKGADALGRRFKFFGDESFAEVVGVAENTKVFTLGEDAQPIAYIPVLQAYEPAMVLNVRTDGDPAPLMDSVRRRVQALDPSMPLTNVQTVSDAIRQTLWAPRMGAGLLAIFGGLALVLAAVGLYGVMSYSVGQRTHEFGIRMALGARRRDVLHLVLRQGMTLVGAGVALGLLAALGVTHLVAAFLVGVSAVDPVTFAGIPLLLSAVALLAGYLPARRATRVDPMIALRYE